MCKMTVYSYSFIGQTFHCFLSLPVVHSFFQLLYNTVIKPGLHHSTLDRLPHTIIPAAEHRYFLSRHLSRTYTVVRWHLTRQTAFLQRHSSMQQTHVNLEDSSNTHNVFMQEDREQDVGSTQTHPNKMFDQDHPQSHPSPRAYQSLALFTVKANSGDGDVFS